MSGRTRKLLSFLPELQNFTQADGAVNLSAPIQRRVYSVKQKSAPQLPAFRLQTPPPLPTEQFPCFHRPLMARNRFASLAPSLCVSRTWFNQQLGNWRVRIRTTLIIFISGVPVCILISTLPFFFGASPIRPLPSFCFPYLIAWAIPAVHKTIRKNRLQAEGRASSAKTTFVSSSIAFLFFSRMV
jgi:hypothetical protein